MKISVYGSAGGDIPKDLIEKAQELGREIARHKHILITGACPGLPYQAVLGAMELKGKVVGYSPAVDLESHKALDYPVEGFSKLIFIPNSYKHKDNIPACRKFRNISSVLACDAAIFISGRSGTLNEFTNAYDFGKVIGVLEGSGGISSEIPALLRAFGRKIDARVFYDNNPAKLVRLVTE